MNAKAEERPQAPEASALALALAKAEELEVVWQLLDPRAKVPRRAYRSAGLDLWPLEQGRISAGGRANVRLGFASAFTEGWAAIVDDRGSTGNLGLHHLAGVVDADYRGEWILIMQNSGREPFEYSPDRALAQILFLRVGNPRCRTLGPDEQLPATERGEGRLGSSGH